MAAPTLKIKYSVNVDASIFKVTDITGAYASPGNITGWGTPNWPLNETALWAVVKRIASAGDEYFVADTVDLVYNPAATNADQTAIEFTYLNDGVFDITMGALQVSTDGIHHLTGGGVIGEGEYFYWDSAGHQVWQMVSGVPVAVTDIHTLVGVSNIVQTTMTDILEPRLAIEKQLLYKDYFNLRSKDCEDAEPKFQELLKLSQDIQGSIYAFYSGLSVQAQSMVETMLDTYELVNQTA